MGDAKMTAALLNRLTHHCDIVDNHWGEGFGAAALGALINVAG